MYNVPIHCFQNQNLNKTSCRCTLQGIRKYNPMFCVNHLSSSSSHMYSSLVTVHMGVLKALKDIDVIYQVNLNHIPIYILHVDVNTE